MLPSNLQDTSAGFLNISKNVLSRTVPLKSPLWAQWMQTVGSPIMGTSSLSLPLSIPISVSCLLAPITYQIVSVDLMELSLPTDEMHWWPWNSLILQVEEILKEAKTVAVVTGASLQRITVRLNWGGFEHFRIWLEGCLSNGSHLWPSNRGQIITVI